MVLKTVRWSFDMQPFDEFRTREKQIYSSSFQLFPAEENEDKIETIFSAGLRAAFGRRRTPGSSGEIVIQ